MGRAEGEQGRLQLLSGEAVHDWCAVAGHDRAARGCTCSCCCWWHQQDRRVPGGGGGGRQAGGHCRLVAARASGLAVWVRCWWGIAAMGCLVAAGWAGARAADVGTGRGWVPGGCVEGYSPQRRATAAGLAGGGLADSEAPTHAVRIGQSRAEDPLQFHNEEPSSGSSRTRWCKPTGAGVRSRLPPVGKGMRGLPQRQERHPRLAPRGVHGMEVGSKEAVVGGPTWPGPGTQVATWSWTRRVGGNAPRSFFGGTPPGPGGRAGGHQAEQCRQGATAEQYGMVPSPACLLEGCGGGGEGNCSGGTHQP